MDNLYLNPQRQQSMMFTTTTKIINLKAWLYPKVFLACILMVVEYL